MPEFPFSRRMMNLAGATACAGLMGFALYVQYGLGLEPCPLCVFQRIGVIATGVVLFIAALHNPGRVGAGLYGVLAALCAVSGAVVAGRHVWLQGLPADEVPACGPGLAYMLDSFPFAEALQMVFAGSGECAEVVWRFLGISMPGWVLIWFVFLALAALWNGVRRAP